MKLICVTCKSSKEESLFSFKNKETGKRNSSCKACHKEYVKRHYKNNKNDYIQRSKTSSQLYRKRNSDFLKEIKKKSKCENCGENHPATLDFHHIDDSTKDFSLSRNQGKSLKELQTEIEKCKILCSNCHRKLHWSQKFNATVVQ